MTVPQAASSRAAPSGAAPARRRLADAYDLVILDLDGVVYLVDRPIAGAVEVIGELHRAGTPVAYATNNASRRAAEVAALLAGMGIPAVPDEVVTSARAAAAELGARLPAGSPVLVVGADALRAEVREVGLCPVDTAEARPVAVVQGYGPQVGWAQLAEASVAIRAGASWVVTNTDRTLPTARGPLPGNGSLVAALRTALDREPDLVVGKPQPALFQAAARRAAARRALVVGDRLDTDIEGATSSGMDSLLVLTGVSGARDLLDAPARQRPSYVTTDLTGLFDDGESVRIPAAALPPGRVDGALPGGWRVRRQGTALELSGGTAGGDPLTALRLLCASAWAAGPGTGPADADHPAGPAGRWRVSAGSAPAAHVLRQLDLAVD